MIGKMRTLGIAILAVSAIGSVAASQEPEETGSVKPILWNEWSRESFERATASGRPILLNVEARWSRSSLWVDEKVYTDPEVSRLIDEIWFPIRVDRDRRPDIDLRYQVAVAAASEEGSGWPLTVFMFDTGDLIHGGSYIPLEDRQQAPGMRSLLEKGRFHEQAKQSPVGKRLLVEEAFRQEAEKARAPEITWSVTEEIARSMAADLNKETGGFLAGPQYLTPHTLELAGTLYHRTGSPEMLDVLVKTLEGMERGAIHDRVGGGFHRFTSDAGWRYPEFEKLLSYNAGLLVDFLLGYEATEKPSFRATAEGITNFLLSTLRARDGGFYVGQWAASRADDAKGIYFTWPEEEFDKLVPKKHRRLAATIYDITSEGEIRLGAPPRNLLFHTMGPAEAARRLGVTEAEVIQGESEILKALAEARSKREAPRVEKAVYVDSCSAAVVAMLKASRALGREDARQAGLEALDRMLSMLAVGGPLMHRVEPPPVPGIDPTLAMDHFMLATAALAAYEETGDGKYLLASRNLVDRALVLFWAEEGDGFLDVIDDPGAVGYLSHRRYLKSDTAYPALNALAARLLDRLGHLTGDSTYPPRSEASLKGLISMSRRIDFRDGGLGLAVDAHLRPPSRYLVVGPADDPIADDLVAAARSLFDPGKLVTRLVRGADDGEIARLGKRVKGTYAVLCRLNQCSDPVRDAASIGTLVSRLDGRVEAKPAVE